MPTKNIPVNLNFYIDASHPIRRFRAPNGMILVISSITICVHDNEDRYLTIMRRFREVEHGNTIEHTEQDNDYLLCLRTSYLIDHGGGCFQRKLENPLPVKFLSMGVNTAPVALKIHIFINGYYRMMTELELAWEIASKNA